MCNDTVLKHHSPIATESGSERKKEGKKEWMKERKDSI